MTQPIEPDSGLTRRTVVRSAAWAAPVIALAVAAPAATASVVDPVFTAVIGAGGTAAGATYNNVWSLGATFSLESPVAGDTTGEITVYYTLPIGYTAAQVTGMNGPTPIAGAPLDEAGGTVISNDGSVWTYNYDAEFGEFVFKNSGGITLKPGEKTGTIVFPSILSIGTGASSRNQLKTQATTERGWSSAQSSFPGR